MTKWINRRSLLFVSILASLAACEPAPPPAGAGQFATVESSDAESLDAAVPAAESPAADQPAAPDDASEVAVIAETLPYAEVGNQLVYGHFVFPADMVDPLPGLIVIHEWWGLNDEVRAMADRIAAEGYIVLAIDLFGRRTASRPDEARPLMIEVVENPEFANENIRQAFAFLKQSGQSPRIGVLGWDFGGGWTMNTALLMPDDLDAAVIYYGQVTADEARLEPLNVPVLGLFGEDDSSIPVDNVRAFEQAMENLGKVCEVEVYPGVQHSFASPGSANYDAEAAEQAWLRSIDFLGRYLSANVD